MNKSIFISLPVRDLTKSIAFYEALGFTKNPQFSDDSGACMVWSESIFVMLLTHEKWKTFTDRPIAPAGSSEVSLSLLCDSREMVDRLNEAAKKLGGTADVNPVQEMDFMYGRDLLDLDGHVWGMVWMNPEAMLAEAGDKQ